MDSIKLLEQLTNAFGPAGFEDDVVNVAKTYLPEAQRDSLNNLYINLKEKSAKPVIMLDAHMDEVGFMSHYVKPNGTIGFIELGRTQPAAVSAQKVNIRNNRGELVPGVITSVPPHFMKKSDSTTIEPDQLSIDVGSSSKEETENDFHIGIGCPIAPAVKFEYNKNKDLIWAKALDDRIGCGAVIELMSGLEENLNVDIVGVLSAQEEVGIRGARITPRKVKPDAAIVFEGTPADDTFAESYKIQTALKKGPMLRHIDSGMITNPRFMKFALGVGEKYNLKIQQAVRTGGSTNGAGIHTACLGIPTIVIGIPVRYIHTFHTIAALEDYKNAIELAKCILKELNENIIGEF